MSARRSSQPDSVNTSRSCMDPHRGTDIPSGPPVVSAEDLDVQPGTMTLASVVVLVTSAVAGRDIGSTDQDKSAANGFFEIWNVQTQSLADQRKVAPGYYAPGRCDTWVRCVGKVCGARIAARAAAGTVAKSTPRAYPDLTRSCTLVMGDHVAAADRPVLAVRRPKPRVDARQVGIVRARRRAWEIIVARGEMVDWHDLTGDA